MVDITIVRFLIEAPFNYNEWSKFSAPAEAAHLNQSTEPSFSSILGYNTLNFKASFKKLLVSPRVIICLTHSDEKVIGTTFWIKGCSLLLPFE
jgi:hypothetical protein